MKILLVSKKDDAHAAAVMWGLRQLDCAATIWDTSDFPIRDSGCLHLGMEDGPSMSLNIGGSDIAGPFDVIWHRRRGTPLAMPCSHPGDLKVIARESDEFIDNAIDSLDHEHTLHVNPSGPARRARIKTVQLREAKKAGFTIPDTMVGNDYHQVIAFFRKHSGRIIYKAFRPGGWITEDDSAVVLKTAALTESDLQHEDAIRSCPGIFQELVEKAYELRVTVIGRKVLAAAIDSQKDGQSIDWRYDGILGKTPLRATILPQVIEERCLQLCRNLNLAFGCIDLVVNKNGDYVFLEINEAGQFLWKEDIDPSLLMLDTFCRYLAGMETADGAQTLRYADYLESDSYQHFLSLNRLDPLTPDSFFTYEKQAVTTAS
ncbi:MAG TPA: hypothetical protein VIF60_24070 [Burkholderiaceae bacterium]